MGTQPKWPRPFRNKRPAWCPPVCWRAFRVRALAWDVADWSDEEIDAVRERLREEVGFVGSNAELAAFDLLVLRRWPVEEVAKMAGISGAEAIARARSFVRRATKPVRGLLRRRLLAFDPHPAVSGAFPVSDN